MVTITLPSKDKKKYKEPVTSAQIANDISEKLKSEALVSIVNGELWDLDRPIEVDSKIAILTKKNKETLDVIRHDAAHIMAEAVLELFPETQVTIGPSIENGFYYDFFREKKFTLFLGNYSLSFNFYFKCYWNFFSEIRNLKFSTYIR